MNAIDTLKEFMREMCAWETDFCDAQDECDETVTETTELHTKYREKLKEILEKYSIETKQNRERLIDLGCTIPVTYDPQRDKIVITDEKDDLCQIQTTQPNGLKCDFLFTLRKYSNDWKIDKKHRQDSKGSWVLSTL